MTISLRDFSGVYACLGEVGEDVGRTVFNLHRKKEKEKGGVNTYMGFNPGIRLNCI